MAQIRQTRKISVLKQLERNYDRKLWGFYDIQIGMLSGHPQDTTAYKILSSMNPIKTAKLK
jgi:hypothetical protein